MLRMPVTPDEMVPIFGMMTGLISMVVIGIVIVRVAHSQIGQAIGRRIHGHSGIDDDQVRGELQEIQERMNLVEHRLAESEERLDFTERLLARAKEPERLAEHPALDNRL